MGHVEVRWGMWGLEGHVEVRWSMWRLGGACGG